ncbi:hypothetical protein HYE66_02720 [Aggregatibacter actinomycetemcomitans]|nr:hypothetical protein [Aggregatibacter actinomycetemcomitans]
MHKLDTLYHLMLEFREILIIEKADRHLIIGIDDIIKVLYEQRKSIISYDEKENIINIKNKLNSLYSPKENGLADFYIWDNDKDIMFSENKKLNSLKERIFRLLE